MYFNEHFTFASGIYATPNTEEEVRKLQSQYLKCKKAIAPHRPKNICKFPSYV